ncbi:MAG: hypothetical protein LM582_02575 [Desulfurococcaceae archaeon]|jgi:hypothetical protein|nr:hypothetical protein [Desulfurococcaceae archaeon]
MENLLKALEEAVYSHSKYIDKCKQLIRRARQVDSVTISKGFKELARESKKLEEVLMILSKKGLNSVADKDLETLSAVVFYVYEVSTEEERDLWSRYSKIVPENIEEHQARLNRVKIYAQKILELAESYGGGR